MTIFTLINTFNRHYMAGLSVKLSPYHLTPANWSLLDYLLKHGHATSSQIAQYWDIEKPSVSANVKQLLKVELITVVPGKDKREKQLILTEKGLSIIQVVTPIIKNYQEKLLASVPHSQQEMLYEGLSTLLKSIKE